MTTEIIISKLSQEALQNASTKLEGVNEQTSQRTTFKDILQEIDTGESFAQTLGIGNTDIEPSGQIGTLAGNDIEFKPTEAATSISQPDSSQKLVDMLSEVNKGQMQMDNLVDTILYSGKKFSNQELLCIQAHVFHFAQMTEITVKMAEQGISSVKSVLNTQVQ